MAELAAGYVVEQDVSRVPIVGKPLHEGVSGALWKAAKVMTAAGLALSIVGGSRRAYRTGAILGTVAAIALRFAIFHAGKASAREPRATFELSRDNGSTGRLAAGSTAWSSLNT